MHVVQRSRRVWQTEIIFPHEANDAFLVGRERKWGFFLLFLKGTAEVDTCSPSL